MNLFDSFITQVYAQAKSIIPKNPNNMPAYKENTGFEGIAGDVINIIFSVAGGIALIILVILGFQMFTSKGKPEEFKKALNGLTFTAIGFTIMAIAYAMVRAVISIQF